jgi:tRNA(Ile)-lysidine synthase
VTGLLGKVEHFIVERRLFPRGAHAVVAVSGGVDSMVLLHALHALAPGLGLELSVAHFNHRLRGRSSDGDAKFVSAVSRRLKLPCDVAAADVRQAALESGESVEMAARRLRHAFLAGCARKRRARFVALAHHADDQVELFLLRLLRGAGGEGLAGMNARSVSPADHRILVVRPLLEMSKSDITAFACELPVKFRTDASNASPEFERNWVRHELLPLLCKRQPAARRTILRAMRIAGDESDFVSAAARHWLQKKASGLRPAATPFRRLQVAVQRRIMQLQLFELGVEPDFQHVEELRASTGRAITVASGISLARDPSGTVRRVPARTVEFAPDQCRIELSGTHGMAQLAGLRITWRLLRRTSQLPRSPRDQREYFDAEKVGAGLLLRHWRAGDRFQPIGLPSATKLQDWFTNRKIPAAERRRLVLAETEQGAIFWIQGERIGESCKITDNTSRILEFRWRNA